MPSDDPSVVLGTFNGRKFPLPRWQEKLFLQLRSLQGGCEARIQQSHYSRSLVDGAFIFFRDYGPPGSRASDCRIWHIHRCETMWRHTVWDSIFPSGGESKYCILDSNTRLRLTISRIRVGGCLNTGGEQPQAAVFNVHDFLSMDPVPHSVHKLHTVNYQQTQPRGQVSQVFVVESVLEHLASDLIPCWK